MQRNGKFYLTSTFFRWVIFFLPFLYCEQKFPLTYSIASTNNGALLLCTTMKFYSQHLLWRNHFRFAWKITFWCGWGKKHTACPPAHSLQAETKQNAPIFICTGKLLSFPFVCYQFTKLNMTMPFFSRHPWPKRTGKIFVANQTAKNEFVHNLWGRW